MLAASATDVDLDHFDRDGAGVPDLVGRAAVEPRPAPGFTELPRHRTCGDALAVRNLDDHRLGRVLVRRRRLPGRERDSVGAEPPVRQLRLPLKAVLGIAFVARGGVGYD